MKSKEYVICSLKSKEYIKNINSYLSSCDLTNDLKEALKFTLKDAESFLITNKKEVDSFAIYEIGMVYGIINENSNWKIKVHIKTFEDKINELKKDLSDD